MLTPLQKKDEIQFWENRPFSGVMPEHRRCKPDDSRKTIKKKPKRVRTAYTTEQIRALELLFIQNKYITPERRREISRALQIGDKSVKIWFQNRRMKEKRESSESSSDSSTENVTDSESVTPTRTDFPNSVQSNGTDCLLLPEANHGGIISPKTNEYQIPYYFNYNVCENQNQNIQISDYSPMGNCTQYYSESNVYPTEYYPCNNGNYNYANEYNNYYYNQQEYSNLRNRQNDYWNMNTDGSCYYFN